MDSWAAARKERPGGGRVGAVPLSSLIRPSTVSTIDYNDSLLLSFCYIFCLAACVVGVQPVGADRENRLGIPNRQRHRVDHPHSRRYRRGGSGANRWAHGRGRAGRGQRGTAVPAPDILANHPVRLGALKYLEREQAL